MNLIGSTQTTEKDTQPQVRLQNGEMICQKPDHNGPIVMIVVDDNVPQHEKFLCSKCVEQQRSVNKLISLKQAREMIQYKYIQFNAQNEEIKKQQLNTLENLLQLVSQLKMEITQNLEQISSATEQWMSQIEQFGNFDELDIIQELMDLNPAQQIHYKEQQKFLNISKCHIQKISSVFKQLCSQERYTNFYSSLKTIYSTLQVKAKTETNVLKAVQQVYSAGQHEDSLAIAFNAPGTIMVAGCEKDIKVWQFDKGVLSEHRRLSGHYSNIQCLVFSQLNNWFFSGSLDNQIRCWKEQSNEDWISSWAGKSHTSSILCMILTKNEEELLSCSDDKTIKLWQVSFLKNSIKFDYQFQDKHSDIVNAISLNESETALVSCSNDKALIVWVKGYNKKKWVYQNEIRMQDICNRLCFISDNVILSSEQAKGISNVIYLKNGELVHSIEQSHKLNENAQETVRFFPNQFNVKRQIILQKHAKQVFILKFGDDDNLKIVVKPIDCGSESNYGSLSQDGSWLVIWNNLTKQFKVYELIYNDK